MAFNSIFLLFWFRAQEGSWMLILKFKTSKLLFTSARLDSWKGFDIADVCTFSSLA